MSCSPAVPTSTSIRRSCRSTPAGEPHPRHVERLAGDAFRIGRRPEQTLRRINALSGLREAIDTIVAPLLAVEAMTIALAEG
jgi:hypothetical protein